MGYTTEMTGHFDLDKALTPEQAAYLKRFSDTRRMKRKADVVEGYPDPVRLDVGLPVGKDAAYYVGDSDESGQSRSSDILDYNYPPASQPGLWCNWVPTPDMKGLKWNGAEKFYCYVQWLEYLVKHFLKPWGLVLSGSVEWQGERSEDHGTIMVRNNVVKAVEYTAVEPVWEEGENPVDVADPDPAPNPIESLLDIMEEQAESLDNAPPV